jgi:hypothetical protein
MFDVQFERDDETPSDRVLRHPLSEEIDDYKAYKRSNREVRDAEKRGAQQRPDSLYPRPTNQLYTFSEVDFGEHVRRASEMFKDNPVEERKESRTPSLHRMEIVSVEHEMQKRTLDGLIEETGATTNYEAKDLITPLSDRPNLNKSKRTPPKKTRGWADIEPFNVLPGSQIGRSRRGSSFDGSIDETEVAELTTNPFQNRPSNILPVPMEQHHTQLAVLTSFRDIDWNPPTRFRHVDWNPPPRAVLTVDNDQITSAFSHIALQQVDGTSELTSAAPLRRRNAPSSADLPSEQFDGSSEAMPSSKSLLAPRRDLPAQ